MRQFLVDEAAVPEGGSVEVDFFGRSVLVAKHDGRLIPYANVCTHLGGPLVREGEHLRCAWHGARFDVRSGRAEAKPAPSGSRLMRLPALVEDGKLYYVYGEEAASSATG